MTGTVRDERTSDQRIRCHVPCRRTPKRAASGSSGASQVRAVPTRPCAQCLWDRGTALHRSPRGLSADDVWAWTADMNTERVTHGPDLVGIVPQLLGYPPEDSLVLVTATRTGKGVGQIGPSLRADLTVEAAGRLDAPAVRRFTAPLLAVPEADTIFPVLYSDVLADFHLGWDDRDPMPDAELAAAEVLLTGLDTVTEALRDLGFVVFPALWSGSGGCGQVGTPESFLLTTARTTASSGLESAGSSVAESFAACVRLPEPDAATAAAVDALRRETFADAELVDGLLAESLLLDARARARAMGEVPEVPLVVDPRAVLAIERLCRGVEDRDIVQMLLAGDHPDFLPERLRTFDPGAFLPYARRRVDGGAAAEHIVGLSPHPPRHDALAESVEWLRHCLPLVVDSVRPDVQALIAWFEWARGRMSFAEHYVECALTEAPEHRLASMLRRAVDEGTPPRWMHRA